MGALGRTVWHDPRSKDYPAPAADAISTVTYSHRGGVLSQGGVKACTGMALTHLLMTDPFVAAREHELVAADALEIYGLGTTLDEESDYWPAVDRGMSSLAGMKACEKLKYAGGYQWAFGTEHLLRAMAYKPFVIGIPWYESMSEPRPDGYLTISGKEKGGHALTVLRVDAQEQYVTVLNTWGPQWGHQGRARLSWDDLDKLLAKEGDAVTLA